jgi:hypothetical protein
VELIGRPRGRLLTLCALCAAKLKDFVKER